MGNSPDMTVRFIFYDREVNDYKRKIFKQTLICDKQGGFDYESKKKG
ncbi:hypothetical protein GCM10022277_39680 [Litoribacillus peritrichatus]|uniref:Uncharacterized protein n=1 Tax=Litoribacillus peritrichatus TaxID=718191 RepID=A0ABP7N8B8_9GAMM